MFDELVVFFGVYIGVFGKCFIEGCYCKGLVLMQKCWGVVFGELFLFVGGFGRYNVVKFVVVKELFMIQF